jgi:hypothetical protein
MGHETYSLPATPQQAHACTNTHVALLTDLWYQLYILASNTHVTSHPIVMVSHQRVLATGSKRYDKSLAKMDRWNGKGKLTVQPAPRVSRHVHFLLHRDGRLHVLIITLHHKPILGINFTSRRCNTHDTSHPVAMVRRQHGQATVCKGYDKSLDEMDGCDGKGQLILQTVPRVTTLLCFVLHCDGCLHVPTLVLNHSLNHGTSLHPGDVTLTLHHTQW